MTSSTTDPPLPPPRKFMRALAAMVAPDRTVEAEASLIEMLPLLEREVPPGAWSSRSALEAVAMVRDRGVPTFAQIHKMLKGWKAPAGSRPIEPTPADRAGLAGEDAYWLNYWYARKAEIEAGGLAAWANQPSADRALANLASLVRRCSPAAWRIISGSDGARVEPTEAEHVAVRDTVQSFRSAMHDRAPHPHSFAEQVQAVKAAMKPAAQRGQLTPEQLAYVRAHPGATSMPRPTDR